MPYQFYIFVVIFQGLIFLGHWFIYKTIVTFFGVNSPQVIAALQAILVLLSISFFLASALAFRFKGALVSWIYRVSAVWFGTFGYLLWLTFINWIVYGLTPVPAADDTRLTASLYVLGALLSVYGMFNSSITRTVPVAVRLKNLPEYWKGKKILFVSDTHLGHFRGLGFAKRIVRIANSLKPDMVLIGGDYFDGVAGDFAQLASPLKEIQAPDGVYFATGNHEEFGDNSKFLDALRGAGVKILNNEKVDVNGLQLVGVDYAETVHRVEYEAILAGLGIDANRASILIKHVPSDLDIAEAAGISLQVSGHTHLAQTWPYNYVTHAVFRGYDYGLKRFRSMQVLTSCGAGTWGPPQRLGSRSEVMLVTLE